MADVGAALDRTPAPSGPAKRTEAGPQLVKVSAEISDAAVSERSSSGMLLEEEPSPAAEVVPSNNNQQQQELELIITTEQHSSNSEDDGILVLPLHLAAAAVPAAAPVATLAASAPAPAAAAAAEGGAPSPERTVSSLTQHTAVTEASDITGLVTATITISHPDTPRGDTILTVSPHPPTAGEAQDAAAAAVAATPAVPTQQQQQQQQQQKQTKQKQANLLPPTNRHWVVSYIFIPLVAPFLLLYCALALLVSLLVPWTILPSLLLAQRLYWACPFIPYIWDSPAVKGKFGRLGALLFRLQFEGAHCVTVVSRLLTLPLRRHLPDFYIAGFPKCGTTSLAAHLKRHPALSGISGMPGHEALGKESHFLMGLLGRGTTRSAALYRSFFPTVLTRWWAEVVRGVPRWACFDACPTYACLPHIPARAAQLTPNAKVVFMVRDPVAGVFSAETMLRNMGVPLDWSLSDPLVQDPESGVVMDPRCEEDAADAAYWSSLAALPPGAPLPADLPRRFYFDLHSYLAAARYSRQIGAWLKHFPRENVLIINFSDFVARPEEVVRRVLGFVGVEQSRYTYTPLPPQMATSYGKAKVDPGVAAHLAATWFADSNAALEEMMGQPLGWSK